MTAARFADRIINAIVRGEQRRERRRKGEFEPTPIESLATPSVPAPPRAEMGDHPPSQGKPRVR